MSSTTNSHQKLSMLSGIEQHRVWSIELGQATKDLSKGSLEVQDIMNKRMSVCLPWNPDYMFRPPPSAMSVDMPKILPELEPGPGMEHFEGFCGRFAPSNPVVPTVPIVPVVVPVVTGDGGSTSSTVPPVATTTTPVVVPVDTTKYGWYEGDPFAHTPRKVLAANMSELIKTLRELGQGLSSLTAMIMKSLEPTLLSNLMHIKLFDEAQKVNRADVLVRIIEAHLTSGTVSVQKETMMSMVIFEELQTLLGMKIQDNNLVDFIERVKKQVKKLRDLGYDKGHYDQTDMMFGMVLIHGINNTAYYNHLHKAEMEQTLDGDHVTFEKAEKRLTEWHAFNSRTTRSLYGNDNVTVMGKEANISYTGVDANKKGPGKTQNSGKNNGNKKKSGEKKTCENCKGDHYKSFCPKLTNVERAQAKLDFLSSNATGDKKTPVSKKK